MTLEKTGPGMVEDEGVFFHPDELCDFNALTESDAPAVSKRSPIDGWFQPELILEGPNVEALLVDLEGMITQREHRVRARKAKDLATFRRTLMSVVASAFWGEFWPMNPAIGYFRGSGAYRGCYWPAWLTPDNLISVIDGAAAAGLLETTLGKRACWPEDGTCSTFRMAPSLLQKLCEYDLVFTHLKLVGQDVPPIVLKGGDRKKINLNADATPVAEEMAKRVIAYNAFLADQRLSLDCPREVTVELEREMRQRASTAPTFGKPFRYRRRPEPFRSVLYRVFNDGRWDHGGRFVGGWWQQIPSRFRPYISINGHRTVELDYSGFSLRAIYHSIGIDYREDPYSLAQLEALQLDQDYRPEIKRLVQGILNCPPEKSLLHINIGRKLPRRARRTRVIEWLTEKHARIAHTFRTREGLRIQGLESTIVDRILEAGKQAGTVVLPIHDSYIVPSDRIDWLKTQMKDRYVEVFGFEPIIQEKG